MKSQNLQMACVADVASTYEAMLLGGKRVYQGRGRINLVLQTLQQGVLVPLGCVGGYILLKSALTGDIPRGGAWFILVYLAGGAFAFWNAQLIYKRMAGMVVASAFGAGGEMTCDAIGAALVTPHSRWITDWREVEAVLIGKRCIALVVSGIVLPIPLSAFADKAAMQLAFDTLQAWHGAARNAA